jgi:hypothetical protein
MDLKMDKEAVIPSSYLSILNSFVTLISCGSKLSYQQFRYRLIRNMVKIAKHCPDLTPKDDGD